MGRFGESRRNPSGGRLGRLLFCGLSDAGEVEVLLHGATSLRGVMRSDGAIYLAVHLGRFLQIHCVLDGLTAEFIEIGNERLHYRREDRVGCGASDGAMEANVMDEVFMRIVECGIHLGYFFR